MRSDRGTSESVCMIEEQTRQGCRGYVELLFRSSGRSKRLNTLDDLDWEDYEQVMGPIPLAEVDCILDMLAAAEHNPPKYEDLPRKLQEGTWCMPDTSWRVGMLGMP